MRHKFVLLLALFVLFLLACSSVGFYVGPIVSTPTPLPTPIVPVYDYNHCPPKGAHDLTIGEVAKLRYNDETIAEMWWDGTTLSVNHLVINDITTGNLTEGAWDINIWAWDGDYTITQVIVCDGQLFYYPPRHALPPTPGPVPQTDTKDS